MERPVSGGKSHYLHGTTQEEQARLSRMNDLLNDMALQELALTGNEKILDVGSGLGQLTRAMARQTAEAGARTIGIERSLEQIGEARRLASSAGEVGIVEFRHGEATRLPLRLEEWGTFDIAHARFLLEHLPDPISVVREMVRAVKPGGRIVLQDDSHDICRMWPEPPGFGRLWQSYIRTYDRVGNDPFIGHRLVSILAEAGAAPHRNTWLFFGACAGQQELLAAYVENLVSILQGVRLQIVELGEFDDNSFDRCIGEMRIWSERPDAALWYGVSWAEGRRRTIG